MRSQSTEPPRRRGDESLRGDQHARKQHRRAKSALSALGDGELQEGVVKRLVSILDGQGKVFEDNSNFLKDISGALRNHKYSTMSDAGFARPVSEPALKMPPMNSPMKAAHFATKQHNVVAAKEHDVVLRPKPEPLSSTKSESLAHTKQDLPLTPPDTPSISIADWSIIPPKSTTGLYPAVQDHAIPKPVTVKIDDQAQQSSEHTAINMERNNSEQSATTGGELELYKPATDNNEHDDKVEQFTKTSVEIEIYEPTTVHVEVDIPKPATEFHHSSISSGDKPITENNYHSRNPSGDKLVTNNDHSRTSSDKLVPTKSHSRTSSADKTPVSDGEVAKWITENKERASKRFRYDTREVDLKVDHLLRRLKTLGHRLQAAGDPAAATTRQRKEAAIRTQIEVDEALQQEFTTITQALQTYRKQRGTPLRLANTMADQVMPGYSTLDVTGKHRALYTYYQNNKSISKPGDRDRFNNTMLFLDACLVKGLNEDFLALIDTWIQKTEDMRQVFGVTIPV